MANCRNEVFFTEYFSADRLQIIRLTVIEAYKNNWSLRELQRQFDSALYTRLSLSKNKEEILQLSEKGQIEKSKLWIKLN